MLKQTHMSVFFLIFLFCSHLLADMAQPGRLTCCTRLLAAHHFRSATPLPSQSSPSLAVYLFPSTATPPPCHPEDPLPSLLPLPTTSSSAADLVCPTGACKSCMVCTYGWHTHSNGSDWRNGAATRRSVPDLQPLELAARFA
jgi:hypothetical protein